MSKNNKLATGTTFELYNTNYQAGGEQLYRVIDNEYKLIKLPITFTIIDFESAHDRWTDCYHIKDNKTGDVYRFNAVYLNIAFEKGDDLKRIRPIHKASVSLTMSIKDKCLHCGCNGYAGLFSFECDNPDCISKNPYG